MEVGGARRLLVRQAAGIAIIFEDAAGSGGLLDWYRMRRNRRSGLVERLRRLLSWRAKLSDGFLRLRPRRALSAPRGGFSRSAPSGFHHIEYLQEMQLMGVRINGA